MRTRICFLDQTGELGGAEINLINVLATLDQERWDPIVLLGADGPLCKRLLDIGISVAVVPLPPRLARVRQGSLGKWTLLDPIRWIEALRYTLRLSRILRARGVQLIHLNSLKLGLLGAVAGRLSGIKSVWQIHSVISEPMIPRRVVRVVRQLARWLPSAIVCNSSATAAGLSLQGGRVVVIPCGVESKTFYPCSTVRQYMRAGMVARFAAGKGQHIFLDAIERLWEKHPSAEFVLAGASLFGDNAYEACIRQRARQSDFADHIRWPGFVADVPQLLRTFDVVVHASTQAEGFGLIIVEAMMCAKPVVASSAGGSAELVEDGVTGVLVSPGDAVALAEAVDDLLKHPAKAAEMGRRGRQLALERYELGATTLALQNVYEDVLAGA